MLDTIGYLFEWVASLVPRLGICRATRAGVKYRNGKTVRLISPGLYVYWPVVTEIQTVQTNRQTLNLESQTLTTKDNIAVTVSVVVVYKVVDVIKALVETDDIDDTIGDVALRAAVPAIKDRRFDAIRAGLDKQVKTEITRSCRSALHPYGLKVVDCSIIDFAETSVYRIIGGSAAPVIKADEDE